MPSDIFQEYLKEWKKLNPQIEIPIPNYKTKTKFRDIMGWVFPLIIMVLIWVFIMRKHQELIILRLLK